MSRIGHYELKQLLGSGGTGQVHIAVDTVIGREVAIKSLRPELARDPTFLNRFKSEAASLARLNHPNICTLFAVFPESENFYMVMELVRGSTLETLLQERPTGLTIKESLAIIGQVGEGLSYAHRMGVIHRDLKPSNLMVTDDGRVKIMDFGIARVQGSQRLTRDGSIVGTLAYIAPEQVRGAQGDEASDIYSLAIVLYELLCGAPPFTGATDYDLIQAHVNQKPDRLAARVPGGLPKQIDAAIMRALAKAPAQRFPSVRDFMDALGTTSGLEVTLPSRLLTTSEAAPHFQGVSRPIEPPPKLSGSPLKPLVVGLLVGTGVAAAISAVILGLVPLDPLFDLVNGPKQPLAVAPKGPVPTPPTAPHNPYNVPFPRAPVDPATSAPPPASASKRVELIPSKASETSSTSDLESSMVNAYDKNDFTKAFQDASALAENGNVNGYRMLGILYQTGKGTLKNYISAEKYYRAAAQLGDSKSQLYLGKLYYQGNEQIQANFPDALYWFRRSAENRNPEAMYYVGNMFDNGYGVSKDKEMAIHWFRQSASFNYAPAQNKLKEIGEN